METDVLFAGDLSADDFAKAVDQSEIATQRAQAAVSTSNTFVKQKLLQSKAYSKEFVDIASKTLNELQVRAVTAAEN